jgi:hypothetical protein
VRIFLLLLLPSLQLVAHGEEPWQTSLARMPLGTNVTQLNRTNCVPLLLQAFQSNQVVKALVFMPGATDEFYMFRRAKAELVDPAPSLLEAVSALTNQTRIRATFRAPLLLLHTDEDFVTPLVAIENPPTVERLKKRPFLPYVLYYDRDWDSLQGDLKWTLKIELRPWRYSQGSWHFYRHSFAAWNLTGWEALEATALAGKSKFTVRHNQVIFEPDRRFPPVESH